MDILTLKKAVKQAKKYTPANPVPGEWEPTKVAEGLDILAGSRIVEQDSNENGEYIRWENGLQVCIASVFTSFIEAGNKQFPFPAAFIDPPAASKAFGLASVPIYVNATFETTLQTHSSYWRVVTLKAEGYGNVSTYLLAIGRWKE